MQLVIELTESQYKYYAKLICPINTVPYILVDALKNGKPLPKGHGKLIDADKLIRKELQPFFYHLKNGDVAVPIIDIEHAPTIIEADKGE